jgi:hypothetical protein
MSDKNDAIIQRLSDDMAYMRGKLDEALPEMKKSTETINSILILHSEEIATLKSNQENIKGKVAVAGAVAGTVMGALFAWIGKQF